MQGAEVTVERWKVGILLFEDVEVLDFAGPFEVFSRTRLIPGVEARRSDDSAPFHVFTVAATRDAVRATGGLVVVPHFARDEAPPVDLLVVPGGLGTRRLLTDAAMLTWVRDTARHARRVTSVCTGALLLASAGLLRGKRATTHRSALDELAAFDVGEVVHERIVDDGIITSAGVAAGLDMALYVVETMFGQDVADETAAYIEYPRR